MTSEVSICNKAILQVGGSKITALSDEGAEAELCNEFYADLRDAVLEAHDWSFATKRISIAAAVSAPNHLFSTQFLIPSTMLHVREVNRVSWDDEQRRWEIEDGYIVMNESTCKVKYTFQVTDTAMFSPLFVQALSAYLASELAIPLTQNQKLADAKYELYMRKLHQAARRDNQQGKSPRLRSRWIAKGRLGHGNRSTAGPTV